MAHIRGKKKILFVGCDRNLTVLQGGVLQKLGRYEVTAADSAEWGARLYSTENFDVVVLGSGLNAHDRQHLADEIRRTNPTADVIMLPEALLPGQIAQLLER